MVSCGYGENRFGEVFHEEYTQQLCERAERFVSDDANFAEAFRRKFTSGKVIIRTEAISASYHDCTFTPAGDLLVRINTGRVWTNLGAVGDDFVEAMSAGDEMGYLVHKGIRDNQANLDGHLAKITSMMRLPDTATFECDFALMKQELVGNGYGPERFGEVFMVSYVYVCMCVCVCMVFICVYGVVSVSRQWCVCVWGGGVKRKKENRLLCNYIFYIALT